MNRAAWWKAAREWVSQDKLIRKKYGYPPFSEETKQDYEFQIAMGHGYTLLMRVRAAQD